MGKIAELRNKKQYTIYRMWHPSTPGIRYAGLTTQPLIQRLIRHIIDCSSWITRAGKCSNPGHYTSTKADWIISLLEKGLAPHIDELETITGTFAEARKIEDHWMNFYLSDPQYTLLNAKLPKQTQAIVKGMQLPVSDLPNYEQDKKQKIMDACRKWTSGGYSFDRFVDELFNVIYIPPTRQLTGPVSNTYSVYCYQEQDEREYSAG